jgi:hypothetical protein
MDARNTQLELFSQTAQGTQARGHPTWFSYMRSHEKTLLLIIGFFMAAVISFSLGVERGKRIVSLQDAAPKAEAAVTASSTAAPARATALPPVSSVVPLAKAAPAQHASIAYGYTIQLASFSTKAGALKEAQNLTRKGFSPLVMAKGRYTVLCVGNFSDKNTAELMLAKFQKTYKGCMVRRL